MLDDLPHPQKVTYLGKVDYRNKSLTFGIKERDRTRHMYVIGKTGMGKSTLLENMIIQDINNGEGLCIIDPHGSMAEKLLDFIPESRVDDVVYFSPSDSEFPLGLNMIEKVPYEKRHLVANGLMAAFKKIWVDAWSARMEYILNNIILALLENEGQTLLGVNRMLTDKAYRKAMIANVTDPVVKDFWTNEYANYTERFAQEAAPAIQNKVGQFFGNPLIRNIIGQKRTSFDARKIMDERKILIVNLSKGKVGEGNANLLGSLLITKIYLAALSRADVGPYELEKLPPFYFYVDEFQNFANESFANILSEARKFNLALTVAHQYVEQMTDEVKAAVFGNVGSMVVFRVGATDAELFEKEFAPYFILDDIVNLSAYQIYLRLMIDGVGSKPFSAKTLDPIAQPAKSFAPSVIARSRKYYGRAVHEAEHEIASWFAPIEDMSAAKKAKPANDTSVEREPAKTESKKPFNDSKNNKPANRDSGRERRQEAPRSNDRQNNSTRDLERRPQRVEQTPHEFQSEDGSSHKSVSLKEALAKALQEKEVKTVESTRENERQEKPKENIPHSPQEVSEDILKNLVDDKVSYE